MLKGEEEAKWSGWLRPSCIPITIILILIVLVVLLPLLDQKDEGGDDDAFALDEYDSRWNNCSSPCIFTLVESIPENLTYSVKSPHHLSTFNGWQNLINMAENTIDIASFYWTLKGKDIIPDPSDWQGEKIFQALLEAGTERNIRIRIAQNKPSGQSNNDTKELEKLGAATVRSLNFQKLVGGGVLHTKLWIIDRKHFYIGSANMDWRSLTQVKELGAVVYNCTCLSQDLSKIFKVYWKMGLPDAVPPQHWPNYLHTSINKDNPVSVEMNGTRSHVYFSSSPPQFCPKGRTSDVDSILDIISKAEKFIYIAVMDYSPTTLYTYPNEYWPVIDDALRKAVTENIRVHILASYWNHTRPSMLYFLKSLAALNSSSMSIEAKLFVVPAYSPSQAQIPFARVNHNKYMVTDKTAYIGTSNWSGDYFINTGGVGFVISQASNNSNLPIRRQLQAVFERDWTSEYTISVNEYLEPT